MASAKNEERTKDLAVMFNILKDLGVTDYEHGVLNQMLEFTYRYVTTIIDDAVLYSTYAQRQSIGIDDVNLAISLQSQKNFADPPSREFTAELARQRNATPLPAIRSSAGLRLPPDRHSLTACNFNMKYVSKKPRTVSRINPNLPRNTGKPPIPKSTVSPGTTVPLPDIKVFSDKNTNKRMLEDHDS